MLYHLSGLSSDLMINIRDKEGLAYFAGAIHQPGVELIVRSVCRHPAERIERVNNYRGIDALDRRRHPTRRN